MHKLVDFMHLRNFSNYNEKTYFFDFGTMFANVIV